MNYTDYLGLNELPIFKNVPSSLPQGLTKSTNLFTIKDGVLFSWDFTNKCVLTLNVKAARTKEGKSVSQQSLLPASATLFQPEFLLANDDLTLLIVAGSSGILVLELPFRCPPYGSFGNNKQVVCCRSHNLDERLLCCSETVQLYQVRFHPGSTRNNHILVLTSDNTLRLYLIENESALNVATYQVGDTPKGIFPGTKTSYLAAFGEVGVDFDFGLPEINTDSSSLFGKETKTSNVLWPVYVLMGDGSVFSISIPLDKRTKAIVSGPLPTNTTQEYAQEEACSIICINSYPQLLCVANSNGRIYHHIIMPLNGEELNQLKNQVPNCAKKELLCFESVELELGFSTRAEDKSYTCPIFLHKDESRPGYYFATHSAGVHSVAITCLKDLQGFVGGNDEDQPMSDIFNQKSKAEYLLCTKSATSEKSNPVVGFSLYYEPTSIIAFLADGNVVSLGLLTSEILPKVSIETESEKIDKSEVTSPLKVMLQEPFDQYIQKLLRKSNQPILKLGGNGPRSQKDCYELLQRASQVLRDQMKNHICGREEIEKRAKTLQLMKDYQADQISRINAEKHTLRERAEGLAEKYEDIKDRQDVLMKRLEKLLVMVSQKKAEPSDAEKEYLKQLQEYMDKVEKYRTSIDKLKTKLEYQRVRITNWKAQEEKEVSHLNEKQSVVIKNSLKETADKIRCMVQEIHEYKKRLNIK